MKISAEIVKSLFVNMKGHPRHLCGFLVFVVIGFGSSALARDNRDLDAKVELGRTLFADVSLSRDGKTSCKTCHVPEHAYADTRSRSIGSDGMLGTRHAPSLLGVANDSAFFWDGRRTRLEDVVFDPFTNPVELGLASKQELLDRLRARPETMEKFRYAFAGARETPTVDQAIQALVMFLQSLKSGNSVYDNAFLHRATLSYEAERGRALFEGSAGCSECHTAKGARARFADGNYHHSGIGEATQSDRLPDLVQMVIRENLNATAIGQRVLKDQEWSSLGRFVSSQQPMDIGAFRTPSLRNVAVTAPYMHDGSIATLREAVDQEIYYHGFSSGHPINLTQSERQALVAFLECLTDQPDSSESGAP